MPSKYIIFLVCVTHAFYTSTKEPITLIEAMKNNDT